MLYHYTCTSYEYIYIYIYIDLRGACSVHPLFVFLHCLRHWSSQLSSTLLSILHWVRHRNFLSDRVSAGLPLHSTPPEVSVGMPPHFYSPWLIPSGDSLLRRLNTAWDPIATSTKLKANAQPPNTFCQKLWPAPAYSLALVLYQRQGRWHPP